MKTVWLVRPRTFSDPIAFESEADANEYVEMITGKDSDAHPVRCLFVPSDRKLTRGYAQLGGSDD